MRQTLTAGLAVAVVLATGAAQAEPARDAILAELRAQAQAATPASDGFSAQRGEALFRTRFGGGKPETPACTACHAPDPTKAGMTRAGKPIEPMAVSVNPERYTDPKKVAKWFRRNCNSVLGRECTPVEKGDFLTFMMTQ